MIQIEGVTVVRQGRDASQQQTVLYELTTAETTAATATVIEAGEIVAVTGASGAGKTTLLRLIAGLEKPQKGMIHTDGKCFMSFHEERLLDYMTGEENLLLVVPCGGYRRNGKRNLLVRIRELLGVFFEDYEQIQNRRVMVYSAGMKRRLSVARALFAAELCLEKERILLLDEPFAGLDQKTKQRVMTYLVEWKKQHEATLVYTTHSFHEETWPEARELRIVSQ